MFKEMRRINNAMSDKEIFELVERGNEGTLGTIGENNYPYCTTLNYVYYNNAIYFHSAPVGHKIDNIKFNNKVCFSIVDNIEVISKAFTTKYENVIIFGKAESIENEDEKKAVLLKFIEKYSSNFMDEGKKYVNASFSKTNIIKINIDHITGKCRK
ncbi:MAG: pyridoxamine 5'-phosphate oxidase family protein [Clostridium argentinense]|uniref:Pyridoxamine 5'-phosphate oxidase family protein n=1 Tax=Clostridium faecium TaxID=2762223 RepID=A0ABR8YQ50_9CLOT|nr:MULTISPECIES: pyridoxamine 5'-phosphate oxidase family protein [Clostridium]MBD8046029.1 pyridoxamine 5'-phosphate oxidase family protein [Clostridium faecium]MBS5822878.1 pyridoxamine 5'-phosphate oxidase family protein [Clostridium argentinense]MDU1349109.1 pyridoxamine 5'-phosphate oxidase family protein [Clostridium argentinense]